MPAWQTHCRDVLVFLAGVNVAVLLFLSSQTPSVDHKHVMPTGTTEEAAARETHWTKTKTMKDSALDLLDKKTTAIHNAIVSLADDVSALASAGCLGEKAAAIVKTAPRAPHTAARPWLVVGIPTVPRSIDYLTPTLQAIYAQLSSDETGLLFGRVLVAVVNNGPKGEAHAPFEAAKQRFGSSLHAASFVFIDDHERNADPMSGANDVGTPDVPGARVRKQTRDVASVLGALADRGEYYLFMEDDFSLCPHALLAIHYMIEKAHRLHGDFISVRMSYGLSGIVMHTRDLAAFGAYLLEHQARRPPDHLFAEWSGKETAQARAYIGQRVNAVFRYNLLDHLGVVSSLRSAPQTTWPRCYEDLTYPTLFHVEAYDPQACAHDDMWPCGSPGEAQPLISWGTLKGKS